MTMKPKTTVLSLPNGLRVVHRLVPGSPVAHTGVTVRAGSRNELTPDEFGLAHFVEHTIFKRTRRRSSWHIINRMESVGGELNAFTTKEDTTVYSSFPKGALSRALDLIADLVLNSRFPDSELDKERDVICDEINSYLDSPADAVYDDFEDLLYAGSPLGHNILGTLESVGAIDGTMCRRWLDRYYVAPNMVAFYAGPTGVDAFMRRAEKTLGALSPRPADDGSTAVVTGVPFVTERSVDSHQAHTVMGCSVADLTEKERMAMTLLANIIGGPGMNSTLNVSMRERRGLVYNVESTLSTWRDATMFTTYFGTDPGDNGLCVELVSAELKHQAESAMSARQLAGARKQYLGQLVLGRANTENSIIGTARTILLRGYALTADEIAARLNALTPDDLRAAAARLTPLSRLTLR